MFDTWACEAALSSVLGLFQSLAKMESLVMSDKHSFS